MSAREAHRVKRPRLSLSCRVCRSRKVRCDRVQPACTNCVRMNQVCVYKSLVRDELTGRVRQLSPGFINEDLTGFGSDSNRPWPLLKNAVVDSEETRAIDGHSDLVPGACINRSNASDSTQFQGPVELANSKVFLWDGAIQVPNNQDKSGFAIMPEHLSEQTQSSQGQGPRSILPTDHLSLRRGGRVRYIGKAFWGSLPGLENLTGDFLDENRHSHPDLPLPHLDAAGLINVLRSVPTKPVCDVLLQAFFIAVWPLAPLIHAPKLQAEYDEFWEWCRSSHTTAPPAMLLDDSTFICLLFGVLLCGASAAPAAMWDSTNLQTVQKEATVDQLKSAYASSLSMCHHLEHPTFNTLVSTLLTRPFTESPSEPMQNLLFISTTVRIAQSMGLHSEVATPALDPVVREMRRRVWLHIVWLDAQSSISSGLPLCSSTDMQGALDLIVCPRNGAVENSLSGSLPNTETLRSRESVAMIYAIAQYETARLESEIITRLQNAQGLTVEGFQELVVATKSFYQKIDNLSACVPSRGIPEKGLISSRLANASPLTHPSLYKDDLSRPTVFGTWTRIMLTLCQFEVAVLLQKPFLGPPDAKSQERLWTSIAQLCLGYLRNYLQLHQTPAFSPYTWSYRTHFGPLQCTFLILVYLVHFPQTPDYQLARYCVDEMIDHYVAQYQPADFSLLKDRPKTCQPRVPTAIQVLIDLHRYLDSPGGNTDMRLSVDWKTVSAKVMASSETVSDFIPNHDLVAILSDLQDCSSQLMSGFECF